MPKGTKRVVVMSANGIIKCSECERFWTGGSNFVKKALELHMTKQHPGIKPSVIVSSVGCISNSNKQYTTETVHYKAGINRISKNSNNSTPLLNYEDLNLTPLF